MPTCAICHHAIDGPGLADEETGTAFHAACAAGDVLAAVLALVAGVLAPVVVVWAG